MIVYSREEMEALNSEVDSMLNSLEKPAPMATWSDRRVIITVWTILLGSIGLLCLLYEVFSRFPKP